MDGPIEEQVNFAFPDHFEINYKDVYEMVEPFYIEYVTDEEKCKNAAEHRKEIENNKKRLIDEAFERAGDPYNIWHKENLNWTKLKSII